MKIRSALFVTSSANYTQCPATTMPEMALMGRSNVGKSSLINMLLNNKQLAKTSGRPGKTQLINHFLVNDQWHLVDLPGYGWARVSKSKKSQWEKMIKNYLLHRTQLGVVLVLVDSRHEPQQIDVELINWLGENNIPFIILLTKADKGSKQQAHKNMAALKRVLKETWEEPPVMFITSSKEHTGREEVLQYVEQALNN